MKNKTVYIILTAIALLVLAAWILFKVLPPKKIHDSHEATTGMGIMDMGQVDNANKSVIESKNNDRTNIYDVSLNTLLQPTNSFAISTIPATTLIKRKESIEINTLGYTTYNTSATGMISARISGRIEKLYVKYRYQLVKKGQKIMDIYSPELLTAQQNLLFLLKNDPANTSFIHAVKEKLLLMGFPAEQLNQVIKTEKPLLKVSVFSHYTGHIHEAGNNNMNISSPKTTAMNEASSITSQEISIKEGMYLQKGQTIFTVNDPSKTWALLSIYPSDQALISIGNKVKIIPEGRPENAFLTSINFIEPFFRPGSKTLTARVNIDNSVLQLPIGSQLKAVIFSAPLTADWLPREAVLSLGLEKVVLIKKADGYKTQKITTGITLKDWTQVTGGISQSDSVATNAQFLMDSESFIKIQNND